ncbi:hypothetical protein [Pseudoalteromonas luteoviolacea]|uniref:STAS/SEC14 domain-containing protein n=1 Tax=Pseudoalteromonas luteoviolacea DSM 6061 TaxID=1365250 RepID=A0A166WZB1_9GAMM|nr:hypothetical protein [Pseudoalteromonas luteoviolacea]KZN39067.1 hypothetical protein N475_14750 [Pseudoalteromonas luteoviolacea DSM 6061]KZN56930.1 hypothetical protein N474_09930 [Pseudoalteromonas luteoviolacea CPMOR-2]TQF67494.1 hypothetical protein FLM44_20120 [Pseudoalteromonas luteoviolacea]
MSLLSTSITYDKSTSLIMMTVRGRAGVEDVLNAYKAVQKYAESHGSNKVLVDVSELEHRFAAIDIVNVMPKVAHYVSNMQIARVVGFEGYMHDLFLQKVKRFGIHAENFECFKSAKEWLSNA